MPDEPFRLANGPTNLIGPFLHLHEDAELFLNREPGGFAPAHLFAAEDFLRNFLGGSFHGCTVCLSLAPGFSPV
jgi:hypothetical protein